MAYPATLPSVLAVPVRDHFAPIKAAFLVAAHLGVVAAFWQTTWVAVGVCLLLHALGGGLGICVGYHRLLTHRSFKCPTVVEYTLAFLGSLTMEGGPIDWVANHRQHHQYSDAAGDPHSAREGFFWSHVLWMMWTPKQAAWNQVTERYTPDLLRVPFYRFLGRTYLEWSALLAVVLYLMGGWPFVVWGMCVRLVITYHSTWFVNSASHTFGYRTFDNSDLSTNCWWVALMTYGEGWHNNHHAFPTSARHGFRPWEIDLSYGFIRLLKSVGLAWDLRTPPVEKLQFGLPRAAA
jgi:stearoyl-CoA desaturase (delta-9 desaturase)